MTLTIITDNPKKLIKVGDLTGDYSCQSFRETDLGYLKCLGAYISDPTIKVMLTYEIKGKNSKETRDIMKKIEEGWRYRVDEDENQVILENSKDSLVFDIPQTALSRRIIKVGQSKDGEIALGVEREYKTGSKLSSKSMEKKQEKILKTLANKMKAKISGKIFFKLSRNKVVYSDAAGGIMSGAYTVKYER